MKIFLKILSVWFVKIAGDEKNVTDAKEPEHIEN